VCESDRTSGHNGRSDGGAAITFLTSVVVLFTLSYTLALFVASRRRRAELGDAPRDLWFVFVVPCLNEELVIGRSLDRLLAIPAKNFAVLVIDDGSEDRTAEIVRSYDPDRVWLLQRTPPNARQGKGEALNNAFRYLRDSGVLGARRPDDVIVTIVDADGRIEPTALFEVAPYFDDPKAGAVQIGVRMYNAGEGLMARMQDFEFVTFTEIFQRGRQRLGSVGLGGNGQFARLSALESLGDAPWTDCLTEDLDLGVRLLAGGWKNNFCPTTWVSQQAVTSLRRLVRQRSRWFQGHLQCWKRIPMILRAPLPTRAIFDLTQHLLSPALVLMMTLPVAVFTVTLAVATAYSPHGVLSALTAHGGLLILLWYLLSFGLAPFYGFVYWLRDRSTSWVQAVAYGHLFTLYSYLWMPAGWFAVGRVVTRRRSWAKTARTVDAAPSA
jgi:cellulose synthase/poly-beta-1,6-N-acetylglucosamine synthase-like glycosyltransferase